VTMVASLAVGTAALFFFVRYRRKAPFERTPRVEPTLLIEVGFVAVPLAFFLLWFAVGFRDFVWAQTPPQNAMDVYVMGKQWMWKFAYPDGPSSVASLRVPAGRPVRLLMTSRDVIHSFYVPAFRIKQDVVPGRYSQTWFEATTPGRYEIYCTEYCGLSHSAMLGEVIVLPPAEFDAWLNEQKRQPQLAERIDGSLSPTEDLSMVGNLVQQGERVAVQLGCLKCHTTDGEPHIGPTFLDLYGRNVRLASGQSIVADDAYLTESMMDPRAKLVAGYEPVMPTFQGRIAGAEGAALIEFIKSLRTDAVRDTLKGPTYEPVRGQ
ncbi:MAG: cytochrome c oxidase subunit II, partial [Myxococcales bacterium]